MPNTIKDRIKELRRVRASDLLPSPLNYRKHPEAQQHALRGILAEVGIADALLARELPDGRLQLIDGHLRAEEVPDAEWPVLVLDVSEAEANKLLAVIDPLTDMAETDPGKLDTLLREIQTGSEALTAMLTGLAEDAGLIEKQQTDLKNLGIDPQFSILIKCEDEQEQRIVIQELDQCGLDTRALCIGWPETPPVTRPEDEPLEVGARRIVRRSTIKKTPRVKQLAGMYDLPPKAASEHSWTIKFTLDRPWNIGLIVGPSGCGKSTLAHELFPEKIVTGWEWPADASLIDGFPEAMSLGDIVNLLSSVGFSSPPHWLKPFQVLSNGEQFRVNLARTMAEMPDLAVIDEFTSVVDRTVAQIGSAAVAKAVRASNRRLIAVTCHNDVEEWLQPDWKLEPATGQFTWRLLRRRPEIQLQIRRVKGADFWPLFRGHHYLSGDLHKTAAAFVAFVRGQPAAFASVLSQPGKGGGWWREHRTVCLPDFQGVGIGNAISAFVASLYAATGKKYRSTTSHPAMIAHRMRSPLWRLVREPSQSTFSASAGFEQLLKTQGSTRLTAGFEYVGEARPDAARALGVLKAPQYPPARETIPCSPSTESAPQEAERPPVASTTVPKRKDRAERRRKERSPKG